MMNEEQMWKAANRMSEAADQSTRAADRMEEAAQRIAHQLEHGYGGNGVRLIELLEETKGFDLVAHLHRQRDWSERTFGPGQRVHGVTDHIAKELIEVRESGGDLKEWVDVIILGLDGAWRSGATPEQIIEAIVAKQTKNEGRTWPDWRTVPADTAIEHDRSQEAA